MIANTEVRPSRWEIVLRRKVSRKACFGADVRPSAFGSGGGGGGGGGVV